MNSYRPRHRPLLSTVGFSKESSPQIERTQATRTCCSPGCRPPAFENSSLVLFFSGCDIGAHQFFHYFPLVTIEKNFCLIRLPSQNANDLRQTHVRSKGAIRKNHYTFFHFSDFSFLNNNYTSTTVKTCKNYLKF